MRALIIFLALLLPLQLSWAAMAGYCQTENALAPLHPGHHEHPSLQAQQPTGSDGASVGDNDIGCSVCHFSCMKSVQCYGTALLAPVTAGTGNTAAYSAHPASHIADGPDKPNWLLAA
ncbi:hypothetical protein [Herbaspirillum sp. YR522]|uniref:hypothetical protein n=1 Tax=Herbaspirillum sp. YR522 TaxID=1144342 RepID=UPI00026FBCB9|nr:hypothetical protein [Herbaspirillum sp. YR522]EJM95760.1 hypothetical protein PMI40_04880 [Herbaspirillum sp. YR522]